MSQFRLNDVYRSLQGEGTHTGVPMVLVRLHGCAVGCSWCDTKETWAFDAGCVGQFADWPKAIGKSEKWIWADENEIASLVSSCSYRGPKWVLITGGEPGEYYLRGLVAALHHAKYKVAVETSGTAIGACGTWADWITLSPKIGMPGGKPLLREVCQAAFEVKYPVGRAEDIEELCKLIDQGVFRKDVAICLQPISQSKKATALCIEECLNRGWRLSAQVHKYLSLP